MSRWIKLAVNGSTCSNDEMLFPDSQRSVRELKCANGCVDVREFRERSSVNSVEKVCPKPEG